MLKKIGITIFDCIAEDDIQFYCIAKLNVIILIIVLYISWCKNFFFYFKIKLFHDFNPASKKQF